MRKFTTGEAWAFVVIGLVFLLAGLGSSFKVLAPIGGIVLVVGFVALHLAARRTRN